MKKNLIIIPLTFLVIGCNKKKNDISLELKEEKIETPEGIDTHFMDRSLRPQDDFYNFVNGKWMAQVSIPSDRARWGSFDELRERTDSVSLKILKDGLQKEYTNGTNGQKVKDLYLSITDTTARNKAGLQPIQNNLMAIDSIQNIIELQRYLTEQTPFNNNAFYSPGIGPHMKRSSDNAVYFGGPSLGMGRDYYQKDDKDSKRQLEAYQNYLGRLFEFIQLENPKEKAKAVVTFEKGMAKQMLTVENIRNADLRYNPMSVKELNAMVPSVALDVFLEQIGAKTDTVIVTELNYYKNLSNFIKKENLPVIKDYLKARLVNGASGQLSSDLEQLHFDFYSKELQGIKEMRDLDKRALSTINNTIGEAFGELYVQSEFPPEAKEKAQEMVRYVLKSFEVHIENLKWMSDSTKVKALDKLKKFNVKIGYPDKWRDYSNLEIVSVKDGGSYYSNMQNINQWQFKEDLAKIGKPVDKTEWFMPPQMVNAYYSSSYNEIVFPAAILQPPFYNYKADEAVNFGGMGAVIGHEVSHGFDDSGAKYDGDGNLNNWWTPKDEERFAALGDSLAAQYSRYEPLPDVFVNGEFTLGENIGDLGGVSVAYDALRMYLQDNGTPPLKDGFTPEERFFISWGTIWRTKSTDEALINQIKTDPHSPGYYRAIGPLVNVDGFHETFKTKEGDKMFKPESNRIKIW